MIYCWHFTPNAKYRHKSSESQYNSIKDWRDALVRKKQKYKHSISFILPQDDYLGWFNLYTVKKIWKIEVLGADYSDCLL